MSTPLIQNKADIFAALPPERAASLMPQIQEAVAANGDKIIILDDDPTGTQTAHDVTVLTSWTTEIFVEALSDPSAAVFVLTNTRSLTANKAEALNREIAIGLTEAAQRVNRGYVLISRSDSTLRGHFPLETDTLASASGQNYDGVLVIPAFMAGGRYTIDGVHYVAEGEDLIPAAQTPFAQDAAFGYQSSDLRQWVAEKTGGAVSASDVHHLSLTAIRKEGVQAAQRTLSELEDGAYCVVDAVSERDLEVVALAAIQAEADGKRLLYRTAASFAAVRAGVTLRPLLSADELRTTRTGGGLVVVGSYVPKSSHQLDHLLSHTDIGEAEVNVRRLLDEQTRQEEIARAVEKARAQLQQDQPVVVYTSRVLITAEDAAGSLDIGARISESLVQITRQLQDATRYIIAKGGITSSDLATVALEAKQAHVRGQILPGVPVWDLGEDSAEPGLIYVVFPGNVGDVDALTKTVDKFEAR